MQGNLVFNAAQDLIYRRDLERAVVETAIRFAAKHGEPRYCCPPSGTHPWTLPDVFVQDDALLHSDGICKTIVRVACTPKQTLTCSQRRRRMRSFSAFAGVTLVAYSVSRIVTEKTNEHSDRLLFYGEPTPQSIGPLQGFLDDEGTFQKLIFMTTEEHLKKIRPLAIAALEDSATLTTALPGMLEV